MKKSLVIYTNGLLKLMGSCEAVLQVYREKGMNLERQAEAFFSEAGAFFEKFNEKDNSSRLAALSARIHAVRRGEAQDISRGGRRKKMLAVLVDGLVEAQQLLQERHDTEMDKVLKSSQLLTQLLLYAYREGAIRLGKSNGKIDSEYAQFAWSRLLSHPALREQAAQVTALVSLPDILFLIAEIRRNLSEAILPYAEACETG